MLRLSLLLLCLFAAPGWGQCRMVAHLGGDTCVPAAPQRIVTLGAAETDSLLALGQAPIGVGTFTGRDFDGFEYLASDLKQSTIVGRFTRPNVEAILRLKPDLILVARQVPANYPLLSRIAPTVVLADHQGQWRTQLRQVAQVIGSEARAEAFIDARDAELASIKGRLQRQGVGSVAFVRITPKEYRLYGDHRLAGPWLYQDLGLKQPNLVRQYAQGRNYVALSLEQLPQLDAEVMLVLEQSGQVPLLDSGWLDPIPAVAKQRVLTARRDHWITTAPLAARLATEQLAQQLLALYP